MRAGPILAGLLLALAAPPAGAVTAAELLAACKPVFTVVKRVSDPRGGFCKVEHAYDCGARGHALADIVKKRVGAVQWFDPRGGIGDTYDFATGGGTRVSRISNAFEIDRLYSRRQERGVYFVDVTIEGTRLRGVRQTVLADAGSPREATIGGETFLTGSYIVTVHLPKPYGALVSRHEAYFSDRHKLIVTGGGYAQFARFKSFDEVEVTDILHPGESGFMSNTPPSRC